MILEGETGCTHLWARYFFKGAGFVCFSQIGTITQLLVKKESKRECFVEISVPGSGAQHHYNPQLSMFESDSCKMSLGVVLVFQFIKCWE